MKYCHAKIFPALPAAFLPLLCAAGIELTSPACDSEVALFRSDWREQIARFLAVPGGSPGNFRDFGGRVTLDGKREFHNHNDVGNFVLVQNDKTLLIDAGQPRYNMDSFHSGKKGKPNKLRSSYGHQVPVCDGNLQLSGFESRGIVKHYDESGATLDITTPYRHTTLENLLRQVDFDRARRQVTVSDTANFAENAEFAVPLVTFGQWEEVEPGMLRIFRENEWEFLCKISASGEYTISDELIDDDILFDEPVRRILFSFKEKAQDFKISTTFILEDKQ